MTEQLVTVFGGARVLADDQLYADCRTLGHLLAEAGYTVASGGYTGTMEAVLRGAAEVGGHTIGYTCAPSRLTLAATAGCKKNARPPVSARASSA